MIVSGGMFLLVSDQRNLHSAAFWNSVSNNSGSELINLWCWGCWLFDILVTK